MSSRPRIFKLRALHSQDKYGVAGKSCREVLLKGCQKFQLPSSGCRLCLYEDGTELTEGYFQRLPDNTELMLLTPGQSWQGYIDDIHRFLTIFYQPQADVIEAAQKLLSDERAPLRQKLLVDFLHNINENIQAETREEDGPWFEGLESRFRNKSSYLRYSCESRIRSYLKEVNAHASTLDPQPRAEYLKIIGHMGEKLKSMRYNGSYFDRREKGRQSLCTPEGWFSCQGPFDLNACLSKHSINPYSNRESRILFSTWNLDHKFFCKANVVKWLAQGHTARKDGKH
ncbi:DNA fragmentation factor subunit beta isoform X2 [Macrotis lagotis]|uniref:DNA fragmentation factor subunit beta isoform X2 n=1 Tax=Macrotis lagotis TaxID=92651 RepID=UPI003D68BDEC